ncbi:MAG: porin family protein [Salinimicrobium sediminis]|uniref:Outer membrane protein beta-barrel domain-containing protein n=1 Tax=Salinimicrobium sediminis TaxID=1343891 RepID=A0A285X7G1_9FLAO|nr:porin family protein [Salinimicrobium sediminis]MDX1601800.1 porin family protein [Salinimicrobium sediminis]MDX1753526.1 porin family protein [Salinimicrobium sediminis]SOC81260.1 Outer membrane protein beta-barrel domain-containing protein [Salinimicrobium sediminis]
MKKSILFIAAMVFSTTFVAAQEFVYFGVKGGVNFSTFSGDGFSDFKDESARTGYHLGLLAEVPVSDRFSVQPEVLYSAQGFDLVRREDNNDVEHQLDYITVPVMAKFYVFDGLALEAGPQFGFVVEEAIDFGSTEIERYDNNRNDFDLSLGLGASYKFNKFFLYGRYNAGMTDIYDVEGVEAKNSVIQAGVGLLF